MPNKKLEQASSNIFSNFGTPTAPAQEVKKEKVNEQKKAGSIADPKAPEKKTSKPGRKANGDKVHSTYKRVTLYMDPDLYDFWDKESKNNYSNMTATIQQILKAEMDKRING